MVGNVAKAYMYRNGKYVGAVGPDAIFYLLGKNQDYDIVFIEPRPEGRGFWVWARPRGGPLQTFFVKEE